MQCVHHCYNSPLLQFNSPLCLLCLSCRNARKSAFLEVSKTYPSPFGLNVCAFVLLCYVHRHYSSFGVILFPPLFYMCKLQEHKKECVNHHHCFKGEQNLRSPPLVLLFVCLCCHIDVFTILIAPPLVWFCSPLLSFICKLHECMECVQCLIAMVLGGHKLTPSKGEQTILLLAPLVLLLCVVFLSW